MMPDIRLSPNQRAALDTYSDWQGPARVLEPPTLTGRAHRGSGNTCHELTAVTAHGPISLVLRCRTPKQGKLGNAFSQEITALQLAWAAGLAPGLVWYDLNTEVMVMEFADATDSTQPEALAALATAIHTLPADLPMMDLRQQMQHYYATAVTQGVSAAHLIPSDHASLCKAISRLGEGPQTMCHNDLTGDNIRAIRGRLVAIDWEYAARGSPYIDVAALCADRPASQADAIASAVFGSALIPELWRLARQLYGAVSWNWHWAAGLQPRPSGGSMQLGAERDRLLWHLENSP